METLSYDELNDKEKELIDAAEQAIDLAYNPYNSNSVFGAAVRTLSDKIVVGGNFGNDSGISNICAERSVILTANNQGNRDIKEIAIIGRSNKNMEEPVTPCGICRQVLLEITKITKEDLIILCSNADKSKILKKSIHELLPYPY